MYIPFKKTTCITHMKMWLPMWVVLFVALFMVHCNQPEERHSLELSEVKVSKVRQYTINGSDSVPIGRLRPLFKTNNDGTLYAFLDETRQTIILTDSVGRVRNKIGKKGKGPEEFVRISGFLLNQDNQLIIHDGSQYLLKVFDEFGNIHTFFEINPSEMSVTHNALLSYNKKLFFGAIEQKYLSNLLKAGESNNVVEYSYEGAFLGSFGKYDSLTNSTMDYSVFPVLSFDEEHKRIYTVRQNGYIIEGWDIETKERAHVINQKPNFFTPPKKKIPANLAHSEIKKRSIGTTLTSSMFISENFVYLYMTKNTEAFLNSTDRDYSKKEFFLAIYSKQGRLLAETKLDHVLANIVDDTFHLIENDDPDNYTIGVYEYSLD